MTYNKLSTIAIAIAVASCSLVPEVEESPVAPVNKVTEEITLTAYYGEPETRTVRETDGSVLWSPGDEISLFYGSGSEGGSKFTAQNTEKAKVVNFRGEIGVITGGNDVSVEDTYFWATYPYCAEASCDGNSITTVLPSAQKAAADTFADDLFPSIGRSQGLNMGFYNICGGIKFTVASEGIKSVTLRSNGGELIAGKITVGFDENGTPVVTNIIEGKDYVTLTAPAGETLEVGRAYFLVFVPTVFENGFTLTFSKGYAQAVKERTSKTTIRRSVFGTMNTPDKELEWEMICVPIPDDNFHSYMVQNFDTNGNGELDFDEAEAVTRIVVSTDDIASVQGIEYCPNLYKLVCSGSGSIWDTQNDVYIGKGQLTTLDVSHNAALTSLACSANQLTGLDVSQNTALSSLYFDSNRLTSIDVSNNTSLSVLQCSSNQLTGLDVSKNTALTCLYCERNQLTNLDVSKNTALNYLYCASNLLTSLDVNSNTALVSLSCENNMLSALDVSLNTKLTMLRCSGNKLSSIDVSANTALTELSCGENELTTLDVSANTALQSLDCSPMNDVTGANLLEYLFIAAGQQIPNVTVNRSDSYVPSETIVTPHCVIIPDANFRSYMVQNFDTNGNGYLDFDEAEEVREIDICTDNIASVQGIEHCTNLESLKCYGSNSTWNAAEQQEVGTGQLTSLDLSANYALAYLDCDRNQLASLDLSSNTNLLSVDCGVNKLIGLDVSANTKLTALDCYCNHLTNLNLSSNTALTRLDCGENQITNLNLSANTVLEELSCVGNKLTSLNVSANTALIHLGCGFNQLASLDVSSNTALQYLRCYNNQLTNIDVSNNLDLVYLSCANNQLTGLDVSANLALQYLICSYNSLSSLTLSANTALNQLACDNNLLTILDVSKNTLLNSLDCSPMNDDAGRNLLSYLYIAQSQHIPGVTVDRDVDKVPAQTSVLVASESGGSEGTSDENLD